MNFREYLNTTTTVDEGFIKKVKDFLLDTFPEINSSKMQKLKDKNTHNTSFQPTSMKFVKKDSGFLFYTAKEKSKELLVFIESAYENEVNDYISNYMGSSKAKLLLNEAKEMSQNNISPWYIVELELFK